MKTTDGKLTDLTREECYKIHCVLINIFWDMMNVYNHVVDKAYGKRRDDIRRQMDRVIQPLLDTCDKLTDYVEELG